MKKLMTLMLGLSLLTGAAVFAQNQPTNTTKTTKKVKKSHHKKAKKTSASPSSSAK